jgi:hypothetical protein
MHYYKLQMNAEGSGHPDWQTIGELEMQHPLVHPSEARFWVSDAIRDDNKKLIEQTDGQWVKVGDEFHHTYIGNNCLTLEFKLVKDVL